MLVYLLVVALVICFVDCGLPLMVALLSCGLCFWFLCLVAWFRLLSSLVWLVGLWLYVAALF